MQTDQYNRLTILQAQSALRNFECTAEQLVQACLNRIEEREDSVAAWVQTQQDDALADARRLDQLAQQGQWQGALHGIPVGVKDIFDVAGMPTRAGTTAWPVTAPDTDAPSVARLRDAGAVVLGKTVTTSFAMGDPGPTRNPWNLAHTPGGSSSGSAAAVADGMCLAALGTQTAGSVIRPSSFNGLAGFKPAHGHINVEGVIALSWRLDHVGALTRDVADAELIFQILSDTPQSSTVAKQPNRLWRIREFFDEYTEPPMLARLDQFCQWAQEAGVNIIESPLPAGCADLLDHHRTIMAAEAAATHATNFAINADKYPPRIKSLIEEGQTISATDYLAARQHRRATLHTISEAMADVDAVLSPAATGPAPEGIDYTGDRHANIPSSYWGLPAVCFNVGRCDHGLPLGLQVMSTIPNQASLFNTARWCEQLALQQQSLTQPTHAFEANA